MAGQRVLAIGLDGFEISFVDRMIAAGDLPALSAFRDRGARFTLDHGAAARTGLAWEHLASGLTPEAGGRSALVTLDPSTYEVWQEGARFEPFLERLAARSVVFDAPYADLARARHVRGVVGWGAHDPGVTTTANPSELLDDGEFPSYPVPEWIYKNPWPSAELTKTMGAGLVRGLAARRRAASWLLNERLADWDLAVVVAGEPHSAAEAFWHGIDPDHPLHDHPSAQPAAEGLADVYRETDRLVAELVDGTDASAVVVFSMGGMGSNHSDVPSMVLLPELLLRWARHESLLDLPAEWSDNPRAVPVLPVGVSWGDASSTWYRATDAASLGTRALPRRVAKRVKRQVGRMRRAGSPTRSARPPGSLGLGWHPTTRYRRFWPEMAAFALPSFYDGRIRVNLRGRERNGIVDPADYETVCDELEQLVRACRDPRTGEPVVEAVERVGDRDPLSLTGSDADVMVVWRMGACAFEHPDHGVIGPVPFLRTGGHTGPFGFAYVAGPGITPGDGGVRSAFDVAPTLVDLVGCAPLDGMCGTSLLHNAGPVSSWSAHRDPCGLGPAV